MLSHSLSKKTWFWYDVLLTSKTLNVLMVDSAVQVVKFIQRQYAESSLTVLGLNDRKCHSRKGEED
jgi:hypothetical protein